MSDCPECAAAAETTASYCSSCFRPLPRLKRSRSFLRPGPLVGAIGQSAEAAREPASAATAEPLPEPVVRDLEAMRSQGRPQREGPFFCGVPIAGLLAFIALWDTILCVLLPCCLVCYLLANGFVLPDWELVGAMWVLVILAFILFGLGAVIHKMRAALLRRRTEGDRLLGDCREFVFIAEEGLVWHDGRGLLYIPWESVAAGSIEEDPKKMHTKLTFLDGRTRTRHVLETFGIVGIYRRAQIREIAAAVLARAPAGLAPDDPQAADVSAPAPTPTAKESEGEARSAGGLRLRACAHCGTRVIPKTDGTCPACQHPMA